MKTGRNQRSSNQVKSRKDFYDWLAETIEINGIKRVERDTAFDTNDCFSGGIRLFYDSRTDAADGLKEGVLLEAGFRCVALDLPGFGRSDKPTDDDWYTYERHVAAVRHVIDTLDLDRIHVVVQDWAGPIGLRQMVDQPERFARAFVFNTWLHHDGHRYSDGVRLWRSLALDPDRLGGDMPTGRIVAGTMRRPGHDSDALSAMYDAPFTSVVDKAGARAFPTMLPFAQPERGGAAQQQRCFEALRDAPPCPIHFAFGDADPVFPYSAGEAWAAVVPGATIDRIPNAGHFVQADAPDDCLDVVRRRLVDGVGDAP